MSPAARHNWPRLALGAVAGVALLTGCARDDEASMRARLEAWFLLGETLAFEAQGGCAAGAFRLSSAQPRNGAGLSEDVVGMMARLQARGVAMVEDEARSADAMMVEAANTDRALGMAMRGVALEARACLDGDIGFEFKRMLERAGTIVGFETGHEMLMMVDRDNRVLVVVMGDGE